MVTGHGIAGPCEQGRVADRIAQVVEVPRRVDVLADESGDFCCSEQPDWRPDVGVWGQPGWQGCESERVVWHRPDCSGLVRVRVDARRSIDSSGACFA